MNKGPLRTDEHAVDLYLRVTPNSSRPGISGLHTGADGKVSLQVKVRAQPEKGKANEAAIEILAHFFRLPRRSFTLTAGATDRLKTVRIAGNPTSIARTLATLIQDQTP